jgi:UDP-N-acetyl-D-mannosaminuronate dehydrogenase
LLGLAYKADVDDLRESPAAEVAHLLIDAGAEVRAFEPFKVDGLPGIPMTTSLEETLKEADAILLLVRHTQFCELSASKVAALTSARIVVDTVNAWDEASWQAVGFQIFRLGVGKSSVPA